MPAAPDLPGFPSAGFGFFPAFGPVFSFGPAFAFPGLVRSCLVCSCTAAGRLLDAVGVGAVGDGRVGCGALGVAGVVTGCRSFVAGS